ncbi:hypothetical protein LTR85_006123 [Meristemomyces frigidus]|nr:hypothetical protein LTR85_006123 [Meristemomyces frigidus]
MSTIIVGIDFGTTYSGVSWIYAPNSNDIDASKINIQIVQNWPARREAEARNKVPSRISYAAGQEPKWGFRVKPRDMDALECFELFKLLFQAIEHYDHAEDLDSLRTMLPEKLEAAQKPNIETVIEDFLRLLWACSRESIEAVLPGGKATFDRARIRAILTVPHMWKLEAKQVTMEIATKAGIPIRDVNDIITESEAAVHAILHDNNHLTDFSVGDAFVLCDAGGGTVDVVSYLVLGKNPWSLRQCSHDGALRGSIYLNLAWKAHLQEFVGGLKNWETVEEENKGAAIRHFDETLKRIFDDEDEYCTDIHGIKGIRKLLPETSRGRVAGVEVTHDVSDLKKTFEKVCPEICDMVTKQVDRVRPEMIGQAGTGHAKNIYVLLAGGFSNSPYLRQAIGKATAHKPVQGVLHPQS